jgi:hypothetical protein
MIQEALLYKRAHAGDTRVGATQQQLKDKVNYYFNDKTATYLIKEYKLKEKTETELQKFIDSILAIPPTISVPDTLFISENLTKNAGDRRQILLASIPKYREIAALKGIGFMSMKEIDTQLRNRTSPATASPVAVGDSKKRPPPIQATGEPRISSRSSPSPPPSPVPYTTASTKAKAPVEGQPYKGRRPPPLSGIKKPKYT